MKLIGSTSSPYVRKVRVVMAEKKLDYQFVEEDVWAADTTIMHSNPLGKVPCLVMEGGEALFDSRVIVEYLDTLSPVGKLIPAGGPRARRSEDLGSAGRRRARRADPGAAGGQLGRPRRQVSAATPGSTASSTRRTPA
jgi:glutathione S-transferase